MHAFIFWGFIVLFPTIVIAMVGAVDRHRRSRGSGAGVVRGACRRLRACSCCAGVVDRGRDPQGRPAGAVRGQPPRRRRPDPGADRGRRAHAAVLAWGAIAAGLTSGRRAGRRSRTRCRTCSATHDGARARARLRLGAPRASSSASSPTCRTRSTCTSRRRPSTSGSRARARAGGSSRCASTLPDDGDPLRGRHGRRPDVEGDRRRLLVHRVRPLPGRVPGARDRQAAVAEAADHGDPRPGLRAARRRSRSPATACRRR